LITTSNGKKSTTNSGSVSFEFHEPGDIILTAGGSSPDYESVTSELEVIPDEIKLSIELSRKEIDPSEEVEVIVRDSAGDRVENALVDIDGESWRTDSRGKVHIYPEREGYYEISADKETDITSYTTATEVLRVGEPELLRINLNRETITSGDSVTVTVYDDRTDTPVSGARVEFDHSMMGDLETKITDEDGQVNPSFDNGGRVTMTATKIIDGLEETSSKKVLQVNRTKKSSKPPDDGFPIERVKTFVGKRLMNVVSLFAIVIGIGAVIIQGLSALWVLGLAVFVSIISVIAYTQIMS
jgi:protocatechuate 3,4-dioxygenase beta subunit